MVDIVRPLLSESMLIALVGGVLGIVFAWGGIHVLITSLPIDSALETFTSTPDLRVLAFALAATIASGLLSGLAPAIQASRLDLNSQLKSEGRTTFQGSHATARRGLVVAQVFLSLVLLIGAGLFIQSLQNLRTLDPGFNIEKMLVFSVDPTLMGYPPQRSLQFYRDLEERLQTVPGVDRAALALVRLLSGDEWDMSLSVEGYQAAPTKGAWAYFNAASPGLFSTLGIKVLYGREFTERDLISKQKIAVINQKFVDKYFGGKNPIGKHIGTGGDPGTQTDIEIVGVIADTKYMTMRDDTKENQMYWVPYTQMNGMAFDMTAYVKTRQDPELIAGAVRRAVQQLDSNVPVYAMRTFERQLGQSLAIERLVATLASGFAALATLLAAIGLYGVLAFNVAQRTREIGIRMALGAGTRNVTWMVMRDVLLLLSVGVGLALPATWAMSKYVESQLYGVKSSDPLTVCGAALLLSAVAALAGYIPALRAARVDPVQALRYE
jgi:predicted permease